jgi:two-component system, chemotaxis family, chemotaxis protein CheY
MKELTVLLGGAEVICHLKGAFESWGFDVVAVTDGKQACGVLRSGQYDLCILDWELPRVSGVEVCRWIRSVDVPMHPHVVLVTQEDHREQIQAAYLAGADDYIASPFDLENIHSVVSAFAQRVEQATGFFKDRNSFDPLEHYRRDLAASVRIYSRL